MPENAPRRRRLLLKAVGMGTGVALATACSSASTAGGMGLLGAVDASAGTTTSEGGHDAVVMGSVIGDAGVTLHDAGVTLHDAGLDSVVTGTLPVEAGGGDAHADVIQGTLIDAAGGLFPSDGGSG